MTQHELKTKHQLVIGRIFFMANEIAAINMDASPQEIISQLSEYATGLKGVADVLNGMADDLHPMSRIDDYNM